MRTGGLIRVNGAGKAEPLEKSGQVVR